MFVSKENPESESIVEDLHALGFCEAHEGQQSLRIKFFLTDDSQVQRPQRCLCACSCQY